MENRIYRAWLRTLGELSPLVVPAVFGRNDELYGRARELGVPRRAGMSKRELIDALRTH